MALVFPAAPSNGDTVTVGGKQFVYSTADTTWKRSGLGSIHTVDADVFDGDGSTTAFTLSQASITDACVVALNGIVQEGGAGKSYTVSGTTLTFTTAPAVGERVVVRNFFLAADTAYTNSDVDSHLNQSNPTSGYVLSWNGSDYAWVSSDLVNDTTPQLGGNLDLNSSDITGTGNINIAGNISTTSGKITTTTASSASTTNSSSNLEVIDNAAGASSQPSIALHRPNMYATKITLASDNAIWFGGWSAGAGGASLRAGTISPGATNTYDLGTSSLRWNNIYTSDLSLSNGIGDYTVVEGEHDLFLYNNKSGKVFKFALIEVDPSEAPPKIEDLKGKS